MDPSLILEARIKGIVVSLLFYAVVCGVNFQPKVHATQVKAFGAEPLGVPVTTAVIIGQTILYLPMPFVFYHAMLLLCRARREGIGSPRGPVSMVSFAAETDEKFPELKGSLYVCLGGLIYFFGIVAAWIWYSDQVGI